MAKSTNHTKVSSVACGGVFEETPKNSFLFELQMQLNAPSLQFVDEVSLSVLSTRFIYSFSYFLFI